MRRETVGEILFWSAVALALALYGLTVPQGLPWHPSATDRYWRYLVSMAYGNAILLTGVASAVAAGLVGAVVNRHLGWRSGLAAALVWMFMPGVWNGAITGERGVVLASAAVALAWVANAVGLWTFRKARAVWKSTPAAVGAIAGDVLGAPSAHTAKLRRDRVNRIAGRVFLGAAVLFAIVSASQHDYRLGEAASAYVRLVVEEAGDRVILMNGLCDEQIERELRTKNYELGRKALSLHDSAANRSNVVAFAKFAFPNETNLWMAAEIGPVAFADAAVRKHPGRFYAMMGQSTTLDGWTARWEAMKSYCASCDAFVPAMRLSFAYEGNAVGNALQERGELKRAWQLYMKIFDEVQPGNPAACVNLNTMLKRGYVVDESTRLRIESSQADYAKLMQDRTRARRIAERIGHFGPVMRDPKAYEALRERVRRRLAELEEAGEKPIAIPYLKTLEEWHAEMMKAFGERDFDMAARIARAILSRRAWRKFVPAYMVLGEKMMMQGDWVAAESFLRVASASTGASAPPPFVLNDYAETLRRLKRYDEAESFARKAVAQSEGKSWIFRLTLAQVLRDKAKARAQDDAEIEALVRDVLKHAPKEERRRIRKEFLR